MGGDLRTLDQSWEIRINIFFEHVEYSGCEHLIELSFTWLAWQNAGIIVREELYMLKSENRRVKAIKQTMDVIAFIRKFQAARKNPQ